MVVLSLGRNAMLRVLDALGMSGVGVSRVVIVCDVKDVVRVYVRFSGHEDQIDAVADALIEPAPQEVSVTTVGGLEVDDMGRVFVPAADHARMRKALCEILASYDLPATVRRLADEALGREVRPS